MHDSTIRKRNESDRGERAKAFEFWPRRVCNGDFKEKRAGTLYVISYGNISVACVPVKITADGPFPSRN